MGIESGDTQNEQVTCYASLLLKYVTKKALHSKKEKKNEAASESGVIIFFLMSI